MEILQLLYAEFNPLAVVSGSIVGFVLGLIGSGGSVLAVPLLLYVVGMPSPHMAIGTSAFAVAMNAATGTINHGFKGNVKWRCALTFTVAGILGSYIGSSFGKTINGNLLLIIFSIVMILIAGLMLTDKKDKPNGDLHMTLENMAVLVPKLLSFGFVVGLAAGFFGIGGGFLIVPALIYALQIPIIFAIGSSLVAVTAFGLTTSINYSFSGFVDWPIATYFIMGGVIGSLFGTRAATKLANQKALLNKLFALVLILMAIYMIYRSYENLDL
ncbi:MAG: sulfite exporter TauE/SafE family protein [Rhizobiales bacterium]|nr:sulfite exporter TauE/SafE family protein [Hyphomicrobiales bacterium]NRB15749.1 sulfite exporter TauE/SafE family protein [Hyphomicrobiales bacterium]